MLAFWSYFISAILTLSPWKRAFLDQYKHDIVHTPRLVAHLELWHRTDYFNNKKNKKNPF